MSQFEYFLKKNHFLLKLSDNKIINEFKYFRSRRSREGVSVFPNQRDDKEIKDENKLFSQFKREHHRVLNRDFHKKIRKIKRNKELIKSQKKNKIKDLIQEYKKKKNDITVWEQYPGPYFNGDVGCYKQGCCTLCNVSGLSINIDFYLEQWTNISNNISWEEVEESIWGNGYYEEFCRNGCLLKMDCGCWVIVQSSYTIYQFDRQVWKCLYCSVHNYTQRNYFNVSGKLPCEVHFMEDGENHELNEPENLSKKIQKYRNIYLITYKFNLPEDINNNIYSYL